MFNKEEKMDNLSFRILRGLVIGGLALFIFISFSSFIIDAPIFGVEEAWAAWDLNGTQVSSTAAGTQSRFSWTDGTTWWHGRNHIAIDREGNYHVVWFDNRAHATQEWDIYYTKLDSAGATLVAPKRINTVTTNTQQSFPAIAVGGEYVHIAWNDNRNSTTNWDIYYARLDLNGNTVTGFADVKITDNTSYQRFPAIAADSNGNAHIIWDDTRVNGWFIDIYYSKVTAAGSITTALKVNEDAPSNPTHVYHHSSGTIAMDPTGNAHIAWNDYRNGNGVNNNWDVYYQKILVSGARAYTNDIQVTSNTGLQVHPFIATDQNGYAYIVYHDLRSPDTNYHIRLTKVTPIGTVALSDIPVTDNTSGWQAWPTIAVDGSSNLHIMWHDTRNDTGDIYYKKLSSTGTELIPERRLTNNTSIQYFPYVVTDANGNAAAVWEDYRNAGYPAIYFNRIDTTAPVTTIGMSPFYNGNTWTPTSIHGTATDNISGVSLVHLTIKRKNDAKYWDGSAWVPGIAVHTATGTTNWSYNLTQSLLTLGIAGGINCNVSVEVTVQAFDNANNLSANVLYSFLYDNINPDSSVTTPTYSQTANFTVSWTGTDNLSGIALITIEAKEVSLIGPLALVHDWATWTTSTCASSKTFTGGENGHAYYFRSVARDNAGNTSFSTIWLTKVDLVNPTVSIDMSSFYSPSTWNDGGIPSVRGYAVDSGGGVNVVKLKVQRQSDLKYWNGSDWDPNTVTLNAFGITAWRIASNEVIPSTVLTDNVTYKVSAWAIDNSGRSSSVAVHEFTWDPNPPQLNIASPGFDSIHENPIVFSGSAYDATVGTTYWMSYKQVDPGSGVETIFKQASPASIQAGPLGTLTPSTTLSDGTYSIRLYASTEAGSVRFVTSRVKVDRDPPETNCQISETKNGAGWYTDPVNVSFEVTDYGSRNDQGYFAGTTYYKINGTQHTYNAPFPINSEGTYTLEYYSVDLMGHEEDPHKFETIKIDLYDPTLSIERPTSVSTLLTNATPIILGGTCVADTSSISVNGTPIAHVLGQTSWESSVDLIDGAQTMEVTALDSSGRQSQDSITITLDKRPPQIEKIILNNNILFGSALPSNNPAVDPRVTLPTPSIEVQANDNLTDFSTYDGIRTELVNAAGATAWEMTGRLSFAVANPLPTGRYSLRVTATDQAGNSTSEVISGVIVTGGDPEIITDIIVSPNPYNPLIGKPTKIWFTVTGDPKSLVAVYLHDITGRLVWKRTYTVEQLLADKKVEWNGYTDFGEIAANSVYLVRIVNETEKKLIGKTKIAVMKKEQ
jgi:hypothetical protein